MEFSEKIILDGSSIRRTKDGFLVAEVKAARIGIQDYAGVEVGRPNMRVVKVLRPEAEVFSKDSMATWAHKPVTYGHPEETVTADNWRKNSVGFLDGEVARDGENIKVSLAVMDGDAINHVIDGVRELSAGYTCDLVWEAGEIEGGLKYDAKQTNIRVNHLAIVPSARGGHNLKIGDTPAMTTKTMIVDGYAVEVTDAAELAIKKLQGALTDATSNLATRTAELAAAVTAGQTKDGEIVALKQKVTDATLTPAQIDTLVADRAAVVADAKKILGAKFDPAGKTADAMRREALAVALKLGDAVKDAALWPEATVKSAFDNYAKDAKPADQTTQTTTADPVRSALRDGAPAVSAEAALAARDAALSKAWEPKQPAGTQ